MPAPSSARRRRCSLGLKARAVASEETRSHLRDAHQRVMSVAAVQQYLHTEEGIDEIDVRTYLGKLCAGLGSSMVGDDNPIRIDALSDSGMIKSSTAVSLGLIVTELVINATKYAFPSGKAGARVLVTYWRDAADWKLTVADNGIGRNDNEAPVGSGLGTTIIEALAKQLGADVEVASSSSGLSTSLTTATFTSSMPRAA